MGKGRVKRERLAAIRAARDPDPSPQAADENQSAQAVQAGTTQPTACADMAFDGGGGAPDWQWARLMRRAINGGWVTDAKGHRIVARLMQVIDSPDSTTTEVIRCARVLIAAAAVDVAREGRQLAERQADAQAGAAAVRAAMATPEGRAALDAVEAALFAAQVSPQPALAPPPDPPPSDPA